MGGGKGVGVLLSASLAKSARQFAKLGHLVVRRVRGQVRFRQQLVELRDGRVRGRCCQPSSRRQGRS